MKGVELYARVRRAVNVEGLSRREAARRLGVSARTIGRALRHNGGPIGSSPEPANQAFSVAAGGE